MELRIVYDPDTGQTHLAGDVPDRAMALDLLEEARRAIHAQGRQLRQGPRITLASVVPRANGSEHGG